MHACFLSEGILDPGTLAMGSTSKFKNNAQERKKKVRSKIQDNKRVSVAMLRIVSSRKTIWALFGHIQPEQPKKFWMVL